MRPALFLKYTHWTDAATGVKSGVASEALSGAPTLGATLPRLASLKVLASVAVRSERCTCHDGGYLPVQLEHPSQWNQVRLVRWGGRRAGPDGELSYDRIVDYLDHAQTRG